MIPEEPKLPTNNADGPPNNDVKTCLDHHVLKLGAISEFDARDVAVERVKNMKPEGLTIPALGSLPFDTTVLRPHGTEAKSI